MEHILENYGANQHLIPLFQQSIQAIYDSFDSQFKKEQDANIDDMDAKNSIIRQVIKERDRQCDNCLYSNCDLRKDSENDYSCEVYRCSHYSPKVPQ